MSRSDGQINRKQLINTKQTIFYPALSERVKDFLQIVSPPPDQLFTYCSFCIILLIVKPHSCFPIVGSFIFFPLLLEFIVRANTLSVEQLLSDFDGIEVHSSLFITLKLQKEMTRGLFLWVQKAEQVLGLIYPRGVCGSNFGGSPSPILSSLQMYQHSSTVCSTTLPGPYSIHLTVFNAYRSDI